MYWIALIFFMLGVLVPEIIQQGYWIFAEEEIEVVVLLLCNGALFFIYLWTDRALRATQIDTRHIIQESRDVAKDLSKAYGHIGEMNRKVDIVTQFAQKVAYNRLQDNYREMVCSQLQESAQHITKYATCHVYVIDVEYRGLMCSSVDAPLLTSEQVAALVGSRTGTHMSIGCSDAVTVLTVHKTAPPIVIIIVAEDVQERVMVDVALLRTVSMIALNAFYE